MSYNIIHGDRLEQRCAASCCLEHGGICPLKANTQCDWRRQWRGASLPSSTDWYPVVSPGKIVSVLETIYSVWIVIRPADYLTRCTRQYLSRIIKITNSVKIELSNTFWHHIQTHNMCFASNSPGTNDSCRRCLIGAYFTQHTNRTATRSRPI